LAETRLDNVKSIMNEYNEPIFKLANVKVAMARNNKISKTAQILFLPPVKLEIVSYNFETALHDYVRIHVALFAKHNNTLMPFTSCENLQFDIEFSQQLFHIVDQHQFERETDTKPDSQQLLNGACRVYYLKSVDIGNSELRINYNYAGKQLRDEVNLFVFEKLFIFNPEANEIVLPIGASQNLFYLNGPTKLFTIESDLQKNVAFDQRIVDVTEIGNQFSKDKHVFTVLCRHVGTDTLKLEIYNLLSTAGNKAVPYISEFTTKIYCVKPRFINLYTTQQLKSSCPLERKNSMMQVKTMANELLEVDIEILDVNHRKLSNISSLLIEWDFSKLKESDGVDIKYSQKTTVDLLDNFEIPKRDYMKTTLRDIDANFKIHAVVTDYRKAVLKSYSIKAEHPSFGIQKVRVLKSMRFIDLRFFLFLFVDLKRTIHHTSD
jgi:nuclear pore complex protein Nup210